MNELQAQLADLEAQKAQLFEQSSVDQVEVSRLNERIKAVQAQITERRQAMEIRQEVETKVAEAQEQIMQSFDSITVDNQTVTLGELAANEPARQILYTFFSQYVSELTAQYAQEIGTMKASNDARVSEAKADNDRLQRDYDEQFEQANEMRKQVLQLQAEVADMTARRNAAVAELEEAKKETERLTSQVDDLRAEIAVGARAAVNIVTNTDGNLSEMIKQYNASKPGIYDVQPLDTLRKRFSAKLLETGETIEFGYLEKGKYREVSAEEAERFRAEQEANTPPVVEENPIPDPPLVVNPPEVTFPSSPEVPNENNPVGGEQPLPEVVETPVTRAEFEALKRDVEELKQSKVNGAAA